MLCALKFKENPYEYFKIITKKKIQKTLIIFLHISPNSLQNAHFYLHESLTAIYMPEKPGANYTGFYFVISK